MTEFKVQTTNASQKFDRNSFTKTFQVEQKIMNPEKNSNCHSNIADVPLYFDDSFDTLLINEINEKEIPIKNQFKDLNSRLIANNISFIYHLRINSSIFLLI